MTLALDIEEDSILKKMLEIANKYQIPSRVYENDDFVYQAHPNAAKYSAKQFAEKLDKAIDKKGIGMNDFLKELEKTPISYLF
jgi:hypothetical protein